MRVVASVSFALLVALFFYLPARFPAERFTSALAAEHVGVASTWGSDLAARTLQRTASFSLSLPSVTAWADRDTRNRAEWERATVLGAARAAVERLANNEYARSVSGMMSLLLYRMLTLAEFVPLLLPLLLCALVDGLVERNVRSREFRPHNPTVFGFFKILAIGLVFLLPAAFTLPYPIPILWIAAVPLSLIFFASRALAHFSQTM